MAHSLLTSILCTLLLSSFAMDTLVPDRTISTNQTLISRNQDFEMGFFSPRKSPNTYLGIWYRNTPDVVVWVANRNDPISDPQGATFAITGNGALLIRESGRIVWSANLSGAVSNPVLHLLDTGNLVLVNGTMEGSSQSYIWQSFDYPTDTYLPGGMKLVNDSDSGEQKYLRSWRSWDDPSPGDFVLRIENEGLPELAVYRGEVKMYRSGKWNGRYFSAFPPLPNPLSSKFVFKKERLISIVRHHHSLDFMTRGILDTSGSIHQYIMNAQKDKWNRVYTFPRDQCDLYGLCGPNSICRIDKPGLCECLEGFAPKFRMDWELQVWSGGCTRIAQLNCQSGDGFLEVREVKYPDMLSYWLNTSMILEECQAECLKNCNCTACANPYVSNGGHGCVLWFGDLLDIRHHSAADRKQKIYIRLPTSRLVGHSNIDIQKEEEKKWPTKLILMSIASGVVVSGIINGGILMMNKRKWKASERSSEVLELPSLSLQP